jgi:hypothetical protein
VDTVYTLKHSSSSLVNQGAVSNREEHHVVNYVPANAGTSRLRVVTSPDGSRFVTEAPEGVPLLGAVYVAITRLGHWRRWDDARRQVNGDAVCRGCGRSDSWQRMNDRGPCPTPGTVTQAACALSSPPLQPADVEQLATTTA